MLGHLGGAPHLRRTWQWASGDKCGNAKCQGAREQQPRAFRKAYIACCCLKIFIAFLPLGLSPWSAFCWEHSYCHAHSCPNVAQGLWTHTAAPHVAMNPESPNRRETESGAGGVSDSEDFLQIKTCRRACTKVTALYPSVYVVLCPNLGMLGFWSPAERNCIVALGTGMKL